MNSKNVKLLSFGSYAWGETSSLQKKFDWNVKLEIVKVHIIILLLPLFWQLNLFAFVLTGDVNLCWLTNNWCANSLRVKLKIYKKECLCCTLKKHNILGFSLIFAQKAIAHLNPLFVVERIVFVFFNKKSYVLYVLCLVVRY